MPHAMIQATTEFTACFQEDDRMPDTTAGSSVIVTNSSAQMLAPETVLLKAVCMTALRRKLPTTFQ